MSLANVIKHSILDVAAVLDPPLSIHRAYLHRWEKLLWFAKWTNNPVSYPNFTIYCKQFLQYVVNKHCCKQSFQPCRIFAYSPQSSSRWIWFRIISWHKFHSFGRLVSTLSSFFQTRYIIFLTTYCSDFWFFTVSSHQKIGW